MNLFSSILNLLHVSVVLLGVCISIYNLIKFVATNTGFIILSADYKKIRNTASLHLPNFPRSNTSPTPHLHTNKWIFHPSRYLHMCPLLRSFHEGSCERNPHFWYRSPRFHAAIPHSPECTLLSHASCCLRITLYSYLHWSTSSPPPLILGHLQKYPYKTRLSNSNRVHRSLLFCCLWILRHRNLHLSTQVFPSHWIYRSQMHHHIAFSQM